MTIGIDKIGMYTPHQYVDLVELAMRRKVDPDKFTIGIGQDKMAVAPLSQDAVSMGANAAAKILTAQDRKAIDLVILGTESGVDNSKAGALMIHHLLGLSNRARVIEIKEACYGATAGLQFAKLHLLQNPQAKALIIGSDIARYGLSTSGEVTQGAGAVAMLVSQDPHILNVDLPTSYYSEAIDDFWRPLGQLTAEVNGKYSNEKYIEFFQKTFADYQAKTGLTTADFAALTFHLPYTKMGLKAMHDVLSQTDEAHAQSLQQHYHQETHYSRQIGNIYTGSLYLALLSLLENDTQLKAGDRIGLFSYGSGAVGEFFAGTLVTDYKKSLQQAAHLTMLGARQKLSIDDYETLFKAQLDATSIQEPLQDKDPQAQFYFAGVQNKIRQYRAK